MSENIEFKRKVGQAVIGNVNEAPRLSNVVTLNVGEWEKEVELIKPYQRTSIKALVDQLAALTGNEATTIYRGLITDYGLQKFKELPRSKYQEVKAKLEARIGQAGNLPAESSVDLAVAMPIQAAAHHSHTAAPCLACAEKTISFTRLQSTARLQLWALIACLAACGWLLYKLQAPVDRTFNVSKDGKCYIAGKAYSIGHIERSRSGSMECVAPIGDTPPMWLNVNRGR